MGCAASSPVAPPPAPPPPPPPPLPMLCALAWHEAAPAAALLRALRALPPRPPPAGVSVALRRALARFPAIPHAYRYIAYQHLSGGVELAAAAPGLYQALLARGPAEGCDLVLRHDAHRTLPEVPFFGPLSRPGPGQSQLYRLLTAYSHLDPLLRYTQGMSFVAALLLLAGLPEEAAFHAFAGLLLRCGLRGLYAPGLPLALAAHAEVGAALGRGWPALAARLEGAGVTPLLYATPWLLSCFVSSPLPLSSVLVVLDRALLEAARPSPGSVPDGVLDVIRLLRGGTPGASDAPSIWACDDDSSRSSSRSGWGRGGAGRKRWRHGAPAPASAPGLVSEPLPPPLGRCPPAYVRAAVAIVTARARALLASSTSQDELYAGIKDQFAPLAGAVSSSSSVDAAAAAPGSGSSGSGRAAVVRALDDGAHRGPRDPPSPPRGGASVLLSSTGKLVASGARAVAAAVGSATATAVSLAASPAVAVGYGVLRLSELAIELAAAGGEHDAAGASERHRRAEPAGARSHALAVVSPESAAAAVASSQADVPVLDGPRLGDAGGCASCDGTTSAAAASSSISATASSSCSSCCRGGGAESAPHSASGQPAPTRATPRHSRRLTAPVFSLVPEPRMTADFGAAELRFPTADRHRLDLHAMLALDDAQHALQQRLMMAGCSAPASAALLPGSVAASAGPSGVLDVDMTDGGVEADAGRPAKGVFVASLGVRLHPGRAAELRADVDDAAVVLPTAATACDGQPCSDWALPLAFASALHSGWLERVCGGAPE